MVASSTPFLLRISDGCSKVSAVAARAATGHSAASGAAIAAPQRKMFGAVSATPVRPTVVRNDRRSSGEGFGIIDGSPDQLAPMNMRRQTSGEP
jgi:hypothetical protein